MLPRNINQETNIQYRPRKNRVVARIVDSSYNDINLINQICEFDDPNSVINLYLVANQQGYSFGTIKNFNSTKKRRKELWTVEAHKGTITFEIISKPVNIYINTKEEKRIATKTALISTIKNIATKTINYVNRKLNIINYHTNQNDTQITLTSNFNNIISLTEYTVI